MPKLSFSLKHFLHFNSTMRKCRHNIYPTMMMPPTEGCSLRSATTSISAESWSSSAGFLSSSTSFHLHASPAPCAMPQIWHNKECPQMRLMFVNDSRNWHSLLPREQLMLVLDVTLSEEGCSVGRCVHLQQWCL